MSDLPERGTGDGSEGDDISKLSSLSGAVGGSYESSQSVSGACSQPLDQSNQRLSNPNPSQLSPQSDRNWTPNPEILNQIIAMGINRTKAIRALYRTGNNSAEAAISWIFENAETEELESDLAPGAEAEFVDFEYKMVFVVNCGLNMGVGKVAAQVAHAALGLQLYLLENEIAYGNQMSRWNETGETKVVVKADDADQLNLLAEKAQAMRLPNFLVVDAGRTQIPAGSVTVLSIFGRVDLVNHVTGHLKLL